MGTLADGLDYATQGMCDTAGIMVAAAGVFPPCEAIGKVMPWGVGGPGSLASGANDWLQAAGSLQQAQQALTTTAGSLTADDWSGDDRAGFDTAVRNLAAQLGDAHNLAEAAGATLAGLAVPLAAYGPACLTIGIVLLTEAIAFEAAAASVVGDLGVSEALYAEGLAVSAVCLDVVIGFVAAIAATMAAAAEGLGLGELADVGAQRHHGDTQAVSDFEQAQVKGLGEVAKNVEAFGVGLAAGKAGGAATEGLPATTVAQRALKEVVSGQVSQQISNDNAGAVDVVTGGPDQGADRHAGRHPGGEAGP